ncbi:hypothetical protein ACFLQV_01060 [Calditrichota bacterium]
MKLKGSILLMAILAIALLMSAIAGAEVKTHTVQVQSDDPPPLHNVQGMTVIFTIETGDNVWEEFEDVTDANGNASVTVDVWEPLDFWGWEAIGYDGPDDNPGTRPYPQITTLLNDDPDGWR